MENTVLPGREPVHLNEDHLGEQLFYLEESQCILWKIILENSCFTWKRASASYGKPSWVTLFYLEESKCILWKIILENSCFTWKRANASYERSSWGTAVLPGREPVHLMEDQLGEQLFYLEESQCILLEDHLG